MQRKKRVHLRLLRLFADPTDNVELIKAIFYIKDDSQPLYISYKKMTVSALFHICYMSILANYQYIINNLIDVLLFVDETG